MKQKIIKIVLLICILSVVIVFDISQQRKENDNTVVIVQFKADFYKDDFIDEDDLVVVELLKKSYQPTMLLESDFEPGYLIQDVYKDTFVYQSFFSKIQSFNLKADQRLITIKCSIIESNGWFAQIHDLVDILLIGEDESITIKNAIIFKQFDQNLSEEGLPEYYSFIVQENEAFLFYENLKMSDVYIVIK